MPDRDAELWGEDDRMPTHARVRAFLQNGAKRRIPITYQELAKALQILPPRSHPSGDGSPGAPDGGGRGSGPPVHRGARHQQGARRPTGARVLRLRPTCRPVRGRSGRSGMRTGLALLANLIAAKKLRPQIAVEASMERDRHGRPPAYRSGVSAQYRTPRDRMPGTVFSVMASPPSFSGSN
jgi:hypothetical protein